MWRSVEVASKSTGPRGDCQPWATAEWNPGSGTGDGVHKDSLLDGYEEPWLGIIQGPWFCSV